MTLRNVARDQIGDPAKKLVVVMSGSWPTATGEKLSAARAEFWKKIEVAAR